VSISSLLKPDLVKSESPCWVSSGNEIPAGCATRTPRLPAIEKIGNEWGKTTGNQKKI
jgi:hypothetical protein